MKESWDNHLQRRLDDWKSQGLERVLRVASGSGVRFKLDGREILSFASNDYLGLSTHPDVIAAAKAALDEHGAGATASPLICGHRSIHAELERELAAFKQSEAALVFPSGYQAAVATLAALADSETTVILDRLAHASLLDGARLSGARVRVFKHNDVEDLRRLLEVERDRRCIIVVESLYSMDGDRAPLIPLFELAETFGALLLIDEAHATGPLGSGGRGLIEIMWRIHRSIRWQDFRLPPFVVAMGTLSKALGSQGGFICASEAIVRTILQGGRAFMFSTAIAPSAAAAARASLGVVREDKSIRIRFLERASQAKDAIEQLGYPTGNAHGAIIPVILGAEAIATEVSAALLSRGIFVPAIRYPTVKKGQARLRVSISAAHSEADIRELSDALSVLLPKKG